MEMVLILIQQIVVMVLMMAVGVALIKTKTINETGVTQLSNIAKSTTLYALDTPIISQKARIAAAG